MDSLSGSKCAGSTPMWVLVRDILSHTQQLANTVISTTLFGIATSLFIASVYIFTRRSRRALQRCSLIPSLPFLTTLVLYTSTTVFTGAALHAAFTASSQEAAAAQALSDCDPLAYFSPVSVQEDGDRMNCVQTATLLINILVGDAVVWWRVYMLWPAAQVTARRVILGAATVLSLATLALGAVDTCGACNLSLGFVQDEEGLGLLFSGAVYGAAAAAMSLAANAIATCFTAYRAWAHIRSMKAIQKKLTMTEAERILVLVVESGLIYTAIWIVVVVWQVGLNDHSVYQTQNQPLGGGGTFWSVAGYFVDGGLVPVIAIYPMFIIVLVALKRMRAEHTAYVFSTHISFDPPPKSPHTDTDTDTNTDMDTRTGSSASTRTGGAGSPDRNGDGETSLSLSRSPNARRLVVCPPDASGHAGRAGFVPPPMVAEVPEDEAGAGNDREEREPKERARRSLESV